MKGKKEKRKDKPEKKVKARNRYVVPAIIGLIVILAFAAYYLNQKHATACFSGKCFSLEVARTPEERQYGLMNRENLDPDKGMIFVFDKEGVYPFWMKNTKIPLDIIWINRDKVIVYISRNTPPCKTDPCPNYDPEKNALYVIELNGGTAEEMGLIAGDRVMIT
jgi:uncharacterized membrane protein (UPF0127 family)